jgi:MoaA/NifB/PqqE/SkfB family radical SAM enzyme
MLKNKREKQLIKSFMAQKRADVPKKPVCMAPFYNMTFSLHGEIIPCFYNKQYNYGKYHHGIDYYKIWNNKHFKNLRKHIRNKNFSYGCLDCHYNIVNQNINHIYASRYDNVKSMMNTEHPSSLEFQISNHCNFRCVMCNEELSSAICQKNASDNCIENSYDEHFPESIIPILPYIKRFVFSGGEPFLIKAYDKIIDLSLKYCTNQEYNFSTNGSVIPEKYFQFFEKNKVIISMSFDSIDENTFNLVTGSKAYKQVLNNLLRLNDILKAKGEVTDAKISPMQQNIDTLPQTVTFLNDNNIRVCFNNVRYPPDCSLAELSSRKLQQIIIKLSNHRIKTDTAVQKMNKKRLNALIDTIKKEFQNAVDKENHPEKHALSHYRSHFIQQINQYKIQYRVDTIPDGESLYQLMFGNIDNQMLKTECVRYFVQLKIHWLVSELRIRHSNDQYIRNRVNQVYQAFKKMKTKGDF